MYVVIVCYGCGRFLLAKADQKTKSCSYCAAQLKLVKAKKVAYARTAQEASHYIRVLKSKGNR
ncbi:MAG TPA: DUF1922 domain-containing protein [Candidatus Bathyarchaeota archaeon]|nr:DUF1922 domain-containing protein [Candidatus Bathyarchaeota archaeon]